MEISFARGLRDALSGLSDPAAGDLDAAVAFVTESGLDVVDSLGLRVRQGIVGDAFHITEPSAIKRLIRAKASVRIAQTQTGVFHPKVYLLPYDDTLAVVVGSSNLTAGGMISNEEANVVLKGPKADSPLPGIKNYYSEIWGANSIQVTEEWLDEYRGEYESMSPALRNDEHAKARAVNKISLRVAERQSESAAKHWIVVTSPENFKICMANGLWGVERQKKSIEEVAPGDAVTFYVKGDKNFRGMYRVESRKFYDPTPMWPNKVYPWRVRINPTSQLSTMAAGSIASRLGFIKDPTVWGTYFQREMISIEKDDFLRILGHMKGRS